MATINRETTVQRTAEEIWNKFIEDPNDRPKWFTLIHGLEERPSPPTRSGIQWGIRLGNVGAKIRVTEASKGRLLRWKAGPSMMVAMGMGMNGTLELKSAKNGSTHVRLVMETPMMTGPVIKMMSGLDPKDEMTKTIDLIKDVSEQ